VIWALLALLGIPIWLIVGMLVGIVLTRRAFKQQPGIFAVAVRRENADKWPRQPTYGRLVHDVLVLNRGAAFLRVEIHAIAAVEQLDIGDMPKKPAAAVGRLVTLDDGTRLELALADADATRLDAVATDAPPTR
jgi:hypothetical protein